MNKIVNRLIKVSFAGVLTMGLAACGNGENKPDESEESESTENLSGDVTMWTASLSGEPFDSYFEDITEKFEDLHPDVNVNIEDIPQDEIQQKVLTSLTGDNVPDVVNVAPRYMNNIGAQGGLLNLEDLISEETKEGFVEGPFAAGYLNEELYALPWYLTTTVSFHNDEHFEQADITEVPTDIDDLYETAKKITDEKGGPSYFQVINEGDVMVNKVISIADGEPIVEDGKTKLAENEDIQEYFTTTRKMYDEGIIPQENVEGSFGTAQELFMGENVSFLETGVTFLGPIEDGAPSVYENIKAGVPLNKPGSPANAATMQFSIPEKTNNPDAAVKLAEFMVDAENQLEFAKVAETVLPSTKESLEDDYFTDEGDSPKDLARHAAAEALKDTEQLIPPLENKSDIDEAMKNAYVENLQGTLTPEEALQEITEKWDASFEEHGLTPTF